jgi:hypothetical protein
MLQTTRSGRVNVLMEMDTCVLLEPFLGVIEWELSDFHVTLTALQSIHKFLVYQHIHQVRDSALAQILIVAGFTKRR